MIKHCIGNFGGKQYCNETFSTCIYSTHKVYIVDIRFFPFNRLKCGQREYLDTCSPFRKIYVFD